MRLSIILLFVFLINTRTQSQPTGTGVLPEKESAWSTGAEFHAGFLMAHRPAILHLQQNHSRSFQWYILKRTDGSLSWHSDYGRPSVGLSYRLTDFGNREEIGLGHSVVMMARFPLFPKSVKWQTALDLGYGLGFIERPFDVESNTKNLATGSVLNAAFSLALSTSYPVSERLRLRSGLDFLHFSNGATRMPNLGLNVPGLFLGLTYQFNMTQPASEQSSADHASQKANTVREPVYRRTRAYAGFGLKEIYPPNGRTYPVYIINLQHHRTSGRKGLFGGGIDFIYDNSLPAKTSREKGEPASTGLQDSFRGGVFGSAGLRMGAWSAYLQAGAYLVNPVKSDGDIYNRLALHYQFRDGLFLCMNLKSHFGKADYIEWGAGYSF